MEANDPRQATGHDCYLLGTVYEPGANSVSVPPTDALVRCDTAQANWNTWRSELGLDPGRPQGVPGV